MSDGSNLIATAAPEIVAHRHELKRRRVYVTSSERVSPHIQRLTLGGDQLQGFVSLSPDDHIRLFFEQGNDVLHRDYTPRSYDAHRNELVLDFVLHEGGVASDWASTARLADALDIGGPRGSRVIEGDIKHWLLIGDESAMPAIARRLSELSADDKATVLIAVPDSADEQLMESDASVDVRWIHRPISQASDLQPFVHQLDKIACDDGTFVWAAGESAMIQVLKRYLVGERSVPQEWMKLSGYWKQALAN